MTFLIQKHDIVVLATLFLGSAHAAQLKTENVFLIISVGFRWQEVFAGAEAGLMNKTNGGVKKPNSKRTISVFQKALLIWFETQLRFGRTAERVILGSLACEPGLRPIKGLRLCHQPTVDSHCTTSSPVHESVSGDAFPKSINS